MDNDHVDISNENFHQYTDKIMDIDCEETIKQHNEELHEHDEDDTCTDTNANTSFEKLSFEQSSVNEVLATPSSNGVGDNCVDDDDEDDDDDDDDDNEDEDNGVTIRENGIDSIDDHEPNEAIDEEDHDNTTDDDEEEEEEEDVVVDHQRNDLNMINTEDQKIIIDYDDDGNDGDNDDDDDDDDEDDDIEDDEDELLECNQVNEEKPKENPREEVNNQESSAMINITDNLSPKPVADSKNIETVININTDESKNDKTINRNISENNQQLIVNNTKSDVSMTITTIDISSTPSSNDKKKSIVRKPSVEMTLPARRSLRNVNKRKADDEIKMLSPQSSKVSKTIINFSDDDVQVIDLDESKTSSSAISNNTNNKSTIFVNDTKHLARIAAKTGGMKKEPTLVIIDTKSSSNSTPPSHLISTNTISSHRGNTSTGSSISIINKKQPSLSLISGASKASITPITTSNSKMKTNQYQQHSHDNTVLPSLTDDMFVVEAPSFIVPYVYEKPSTKSLKGFLNEYKKEIEANYVEKKKKKSNRTKQHKSDKDRVPKNTDNSKEKGDSSDENSSTTTITSSSENESEEFDSDEPLKQNSLIKKIDNKNTTSATTTSAKTTTQMKKPQSESTSYFESPIGKFLIKIGFNLVREPVQEDLLRHQKRMKNKTPETEQNIASLMKNIALSKEQNQVFKQELKKCDHCTFKTESILVLLHHLQRPHMRNNMYLCSYCKEETSSVELIVKHTTIRHQIQPWLERLPSPFQCSLCPFEDFQRGKLSRHIISCGKRFRIEDNLAPPIDWEPPAKIPRVPRVKQTGLAGAASAYQLMAAQQNKMHHFSFQQHQSLQHHHQQSQQQQRHGIVPGALPLSSLHQRNRNNKILPSSGLTSNALHFSRLNAVGTSGSVITTKSILPKSLSLNTQSGHNNNKALHHPSISITPLPRQGNVLSNSGRLNMSGGSISSGLNISSGGSDHNNSTTSNTGSGKPTFVICEICDGYIKDLEMLRNHMQWIHKVKIHPKMIYNRPPLNCQKCQFRFFTDQGLERHLLGSHGLVTSSMQEAANKSKDGGRCPICGKVYQWKLLNHVDKEHKMPLKPAHLSYKCTVCTATFGMYKQFENHVYSSHSMVAKKLMDKKGPQSSSSTASGNNNAATTSTTSHSNKSSDSFKPMMKFNDEITIIPQPAKK